MTCKDAVFLLSSEWYAGMNATVLSLVQHLKYQPLKYLFKRKSLRRSVYVIKDMIPDLQVNIRKKARVGVLLVFIQCRKVSVFIPAYSAFLF